MMERGLIFVRGVWSRYMSAQLEGVVGNTGLCDSPYYVLI